MTPAEVNAQIKKWMPLVYLVAKGFHKRLAAQHDHDDVLALGTIALWNALQTYDPNNAAGAKFSTYARRCILYVYLNEVKAMNASTPRVAFKCQSLELEHPDGTPKVQPFSDTASPEDELLTRERDEALAHAVKRLPERLRGIMAMRLEKDMMLAEVGDAIGVSRERARQLETKAFKGTRAQMRDHTG